LLWTARGAVSSHVMMCVLPFGYELFRYFVSASKCERVVDIHLGNRISYTAVFAVYEK
jgi:hypothetical protein